MSTKSFVDYDTGILLLIGVFANLVRDWFFFFFFEGGDRSFFEELKFDKLEEFKFLLENQLLLVRGYG